MDWIYRELPKFQDEFAPSLYEYEEVQAYHPLRETPKARAIAALRGLTREALHELIEARLEYVLSKLRVLETHFVSGRSASGERTQATPRKDEFNLVAVDIVLKYPQHKFLYANPRHLESSGDDPNHLQQNYVMGFVFLDAEGQPVLSITDDWYENLEEVYATLTVHESVCEAEMQVDNRYSDGRESGEQEAWRV